MSKEIAAKSTGFYGESGVGKTTQLAIIAKWLYAKTGKTVRLISAEDSTKTVFESLINAGIVEAAFISKVPQPVPVLRRLRMGQWKGSDGKWTELDGNTYVSGYIIEGLATISEQLLEYCRSNNMFLGGQTKDVYKEDGFAFGAAGLTAYGFVQSEMIANIQAFAQIPGILRNFWTAHEAKGQDADGNKIRGPALVGSAATHNIQKYFGMLLHMDAVTADPKTKNVERRIYFERHADPLYPAIYYPAKVTLPPNCKHMTEHFGREYVVATRTTGIEQILDVEEELLASATSDDVEFKKKIDAQFATTKLEVVK